MILATSPNGLLGCPCLPPFGHSVQYEEPGARLEPEETNQGHLKMAEMRILGSGDDPALRALTLRRSDKPEFRPCLSGDGGAVRDAIYLAVRTHDDTTGYALYLGEWAELPLGGGRRLNQTMSHIDTLATGRMGSQGHIMSILAPVQGCKVIPDPACLLRPLSQQGGIGTTLRDVVSTRFLRRTHLPDPLVQGSFRQRVAHGPPGG